VDTVAKLPFVHENVPCLISKNGQLKVWDCVTPCNLVKEHRLEPEPEKKRSKQRSFLSSLLDSEDVGGAFLRKVGKNYIRLHGIISE
jgi:hypothetical protein